MPAADAGAVVRKLRVDRRQSSELLSQDILASRDIADDEHVAPADRRAMSVRRQREDNRPAIRQLLEDNAGRRVDDHDTRVGGYGNPTDCAGDIANVRPFNWHTPA